MVVLAGILVDSDDLYIMESGYIKVLERCEYIIKKEKEKKKVRYSLTYGRYSMNIVKGI